MKGMYMHFCEYCGADMPDGASFCGRCGRVSTNAQPQQTPGYSPADEPTNQIGAQSDVPYPITRSTRKPYQYNPLPPEPQPYRSMADQPAARYSQRTPSPSSWQQGPAPAAQQNAQPYPAQPYPAQRPLVIGGAPSSPGAKPRRPFRRRRGCQMNPVFSSTRPFNHG